MYAPIAGTSAHWSLLPAQHDLDHGTFKELNPDLAPNDVLHFPDYQEKLAAASVKTGLKEGCRHRNRQDSGRAGGGSCAGQPIFMGSMSTAVGDKITRAIEYAAAKHLPLVIFRPAAARGCRRAFSA